MKFAPLIEGEVKTGAIGHHVAGHGFSVGREAELTDTDFDVIHFWPPIDKMGKSEGRSTSPRHRLCT